MTSDDIFWERLLEMPDIEAEQELVTRRTIVVRENVELAAFRTGRIGKDADEAGLRIRDNGLQLTLLNEHLAIVRRRMDRANWRMAVKACFGEDGYAKCRAWIIQEELG